MIVLHSYTSRVVRGATFASPPRLSCGFSAAKIRRARRMDSTGPASGVTPCNARHKSSKPIVALSSRGDRKQPAVPSLVWLTKQAQEKLPISLVQHVARGLRQTWAEFVGLEGIVAAFQALSKVLALLVNELVIFQVQAVPLGLRILRRYNFGTGISKDVRYGERSHQVLDFYRPEKRHGSTAPLPLVIWVHGGSWGQGAKWQYSLLASRVCHEHNVCVAVMQYALFPTQRGDGMIEDVKACMDWALGKGAGDAESSMNAGGVGRVILVGQSAGAHLCAMALLQRAQAAADSGASTDIALPNRFVALSGVYDIESHYWHERQRRVHLISPMWDVMHGPDNWHHFSPTQILLQHTERRVNGINSEGRSEVDSLRKWLPAMKILHCKSDSTVPVKSSRDFVAALKEEAECVEFYELENSGHGELVVALMTDVTNKETDLVISSMDGWN